MIVVGVDGSEGSRKALAWAVAEAKLRNTQLRVVSAWELPTVYAAPGFVPPVDFDPEAYEKAASRIVDSALEEQQSATQDIEIDRVVTNGHAAHVLVDASADAELLVVGSRGRGGFAGMLLGSVSQHCVQHAHCPVVVIRNDKGS
jgi:nucleotide-binding universal stress UspA family protein